MKKDKRVVVTGLGVVSSIGIGWKEFWGNLIVSKSGISKVGLFDTSKFNRHTGGEIKNFNPLDFIPAKMAKFLGRASAMAIAAAKLALKDAKLTLTECREKEAGVIIGITMAESNVMDFSFEKYLNDKWDDVTKALLLNTFSASTPRNIGQLFKLKSPYNILIPNACAAGNYCISYAYDLIKSGEADLIMAGGAEGLSRVAFQGFQRLYAMSTEVCSPFDKNRKGMLLGEGAGMLVIESMENALKRGAPIYAEILGYGLSCDAHHIAIPKRDGVKKAMERAIKNSGLTTNDIDYISAHGTGTTQNDREEASAVKELFGDKRVPTSSIKSMLGHCMGAASAIEAIVCCLAIKDSLVPPTINFTTPDPDCDIDCVPNKAREVKVRAALNNGFAFGGNNCCTVFKEIK